MYKNTLKTCKAMRINIDRLPQQLCQSEGSYSEVVIHENDALTSRLNIKDLTVYLTHRRK